MFAITFDAVSYLDAVRRARMMGVFGDIVPAGRRAWICWAN